jgi:ferredoxin
MIISQQKPLELLLQLIQDKSVFLIGCSECATICHTGGETEVIEMKKKLEENHIHVTGWTILDPACHLLNDKRLLKPYKKEIEDAYYLLMFSCGDGLQVISKLYPAKRILSGTNTLFLGAELERGTFSRICNLCGECIADEFDGLCPISRCPKNMLNGPCGGSMNGKCELSDQLPCVWDEIIRKKITRNSTDALKIIKKPKDWTVYRFFNWRENNSI